VNSTTKDWVVWLVNIQTQLVFNFKETQIWYKENVDVYYKDQPNFKVRNQLALQQKHIKTIWPLEKLEYQKLGPFTITKQINIVAFQLKFPNSMKIHLTFHVSLLESYHAFIIQWCVLEPPSLLEINGEQKYEMEEIFNFKLFNQQL
jgi:hypothetical protein